MKEEKPEDAAEEDEKAKASLEDVAEEEAAEESEVEAASLKKRPTDAEDKAE